MKNLIILLIFLSVIVLLSGSVAAQHYSAWTEPVNIGSPVNTLLPDNTAFITKDGLRLYFGRAEGGLATSPNDLWVAHRSEPEGAWEDVQILPAIINQPGTNANYPFLTVDGHCMYFNSNRKTADSNGVLPYGRNDLYVACRSNKRDDSDGLTGWQGLMNLGAGVNTAAREQSPWIFENEETGVTSLYFQSDRFGTYDIFVSRLQLDGTFGPAEIVPELSSPYSDEAPTLSRDGLEIYFISNRPGSQPYPETGLPAPDIWVSTRATTSDAWSVPQNLDSVNVSKGGSVINSPFHDGRPSLSFDGTIMYFFSAERTGNVSPYTDIWMTTRTKLTGQRTP